MSEAVDQTILVVDIVGSTRLYELIGDVLAKRAVTECLDKLTETAASRGGTVVAQLGDELVIRFDDVTEAATAASEMHLNAERDLEQTTPEQPPMQLRIGMNAGGLVVEPFDSVSDVVAIARRAGELAKAEQTLVTQEVMTRLPGIFRAMTRYVDREPFRGAATTWLELHELVWAVEGLTVAEPGSPIPLATMLRVRLRHGDREWILDERRPMLTAGRSDTNDIVIASDLASRQQFTLKFRDGKCTLTDMSTNATYVASHEGEATRVWKEPFSLRGEGRLYVGEPCEENEAAAIIFRCE